MNLKNRGENNIGRKPMSRDLNIYIEGIPEEDKVIHELLRKHCIQLESKNFNFNYLLKKIRKGLYE